MREGEDERGQKKVEMIEKGKRRKRCEEMRGERKIKIWEER
jgi:hypothetical protein